MEVVVVAEVVVKVAQKANSENKTMNVSKIATKTDTTSIIGIDNRVHVELGVGCDVNEEAQIGIEIKINHKVVEHTDTAVVA